MLINRLYCGRFKDSRNLIYFTVDKDDEARTGCLDYLIDMLEQHALNSTILDVRKIEGLKFKFPSGYRKKIWLF